ncbi:hypothetical protein BDQ17DRAFT_1440607 [Cyathus striatus]|nr:hypothetical protein BDQ17DRAFT_1440607 [Cyathus striatus]
MVEPSTLPHSHQTPLLSQIDPSLQNNSGKWVRDDDQTNSPSKCMFLLAGTLSAMSSGSLLSTARASHLEIVRYAMPPSQTLGSTLLVEPNWSLLHDCVDIETLPCVALENRYSLLLKNLQFVQDRDKACQSINEAGNAQLIVQNLALSRLNHTLYEKENRKKSDCTVLFPGGLGRHLTDPELIQAKRAHEEDKKREEREKMRRKDDKKRRKEEKGCRDEEWKQIIAAHKDTVKEWE